MAGEHPTPDRSAQLLVLIRVSNADSWHPLDRDERISLERLRLLGLVEDASSGWVSTPAGDWAVERMIQIMENWRKAFGER